MRKGNLKALLPILVFLVLYLGLGILFEYVLKIPMGFYNIPIVVVFMVALIVACVQTKQFDYAKKFEIMGKGISDPNIITMVLIFMLAGIFVGVVGRSAANSVAYFILSLIPAKFFVAVLFLISCFVSIAMGTSVGTVTLITPIAFAISNASGFSLPLCVASVIGGAMFGDNLSFISDTTIAACNGQGCAMKDKFRSNFAIALPAAVVTVILICIVSMKEYSGDVALEDYNLIQIIPYVLVLIGGIVGIDVFLVLIIGIVSGIIIMLTTGASTPIELFANMGTGVSSMFETTVITILVAAMCALVRENGGFDALLSLIRFIFKGQKAGQLGIGLLVGLIDVATASNTVAIVIANPIAKQIATEYQISPKRTASLLDTFSCIVQGIIPYGAQMLVAISAISGLGGIISSFDIIPYLFYPFLLLISSIVFMFFGRAKE